MFASDEDVAFFQQNGWAIIRNVVDLKVIHQVRDFLEQKKSDLLQKIQYEIGVKETDILSFLEKIKNNQEKLSSFSKTTQDALFGHYDLETRLSDILRMIPQQVDLQQRLKSMLKSDKLYMHMPPTARFILPANNFAGVPAHQDVSYNQHMSNFIVCWVPFVEINDKCGGVRIWKNSNIQRDLLTDKNYVNQNNLPLFWHAGLKTTEFEEFHAEMHPGDVLLLNKWIVHESIGNHADYTRISVDYRFFGAHDSSTKHFFDFEKNVVVNPNN